MCLCIKDVHTPSCNIWWAPSFLTTHLPDFLSTAALNDPTDGLMVDNGTNTRNLTDSHLSISLKYSPSQILNLGVISVCYLKQNKKHRVHADSTTCCYNRALHLWKLWIFYTQPSGSLTRCAAVRCVQLLCISSLKEDCVVMVRTSWAMWPIIAVEISSVCLTPAFCLNQCS